MHLHWDGNNTSVDERNLSASLGAGITPVTVDYASLQRIHDWIWTLPPPKYPFAIDSGRSMRGKAIYDQHCAECHSFSGSKTGTVESLASVNTDPYRLRSFTYIFAVNQANLFPGSRYRFTHFSKTDGYANQPLDGIWARAPYLHNGSVPTLADLLMDPSSRPKQFVAVTTFTISRKSVSFTTHPKLAARVSFMTRRFRGTAMEVIFGGQDCPQTKNRI